MKDKLKFLELGLISRAELWTGLMYLVEPVAVAPITPREHLREVAPSRH